jgi:hypothetical protein
MISVLAFALSQALDGPSPHGHEPGPRAALAGMAGVQCTSRLEGADGAALLTVVYLFPDRVRWHLESGAPEAPTHVYRYRLGERVHEGTGASSLQVEGEARDALLLDLELRRAVLCWPDGFDWSPGEAGASSATVFRDSCCRQGPLGTLLASLENGRPVRVRARDARGLAGASFEVRAWQERSGRPWPAQVAVESAQGSWIETIESLGTRVHYIEESFLPPDRRPPSGESSAGQPLVARDLVGMTYAASDLPAGATWEEARRRARERLLELREASPDPSALDPVPAFGIGSDGLPRSSWVRLRAPVDPPPPGFTSTGERVGFVVPLRSISEVDGDLLARLARCAPAGSRAAGPYVRFHDRPQFPIELVVPLEAKE